MEFCYIIFCVVYRNVTHKELLCKTSILIYYHMGQMKNNRKTA